ncbi:MAG: hypothetical protein H0U59_03275 [Gemmatimonadaceae bacterium]|nr:hypothetical protein [Gemmatimonadaceae bacterium]
MTKTTIDVPDGNRGWKKQEVDVVDGASADPKKQATAQSQTFINEAGELTEKLLGFDMVFIKDRGLVKEHRAFAAALYCINLRETYPDGPAAFDEIAAAAATYYDENKDKVKS